LEAGKYPTPEKFAEDVRLVWSNAMTYNRPDSDIYITAEKLSKIFEKRFGKIKSAKPAKRKRSDTGEKAQEVTRADRVKFSQLVNQLSVDELGKLVDMIQRECPQALTEEDDDELEIEINVIDGPTLGALNAFCNSCINSAKAKRKK